MTTNGPPASPRHLYRALAYTLVWAVVTYLMSHFIAQNTIDNQNDYSNSGWKNPDVWMLVAVSAVTAILCLFFWYLGYVKEVNPERHRKMRFAMSIVFMLWGAWVLYERHRLSDKPPIPNTPNDYPGNTEWPL